MSLQAKDFAVGDRVVNKTFPPISRHTLALYCGASGDHNPIHVDLDFAKKAEMLNPGFYQNSLLQGRALLTLGRRGEARTALERALAEQPAFLKEKKQIEDLLKQATGGN